MPPRKAAKAAKPTPPSGSGFEASPEALAVASKAAGTLWWWDSANARWRTRDAAVTPGTGTMTTLKDTQWTPWTTLLDTSEAPYFRWFAGANTNACFNAVDRHVLDGRGSEVAMTSLPEEATAMDPTCSVTRRELLGAVSIVASKLTHEHGVKAFDRILFHCPTDLSHCVYMLACQRLGAAYSATAVDAAVDVLTARIEDLQPKLVVSAAKGATVHGGQSIDCAAKARTAIDAVKGSIEKPFAITLEPTWHALHKKFNLDKWQTMSDAEAFHTANPAEPTTKSQKKKTKHPYTVSCYPCETDHPLFVSYTSGSTGKPKGVVHGHGGYVSGVLESMRCVFDTEHGSGDSILTVGSSGWITGQSYMLMGPLLAGVRSVLMVGSPVYPTPLRMFETIERESITILKTGSATVRQLMTDPVNAAKLDAIDTSSLKIATFCAEPVSVEVHEYAHAHVTPNFINSYWATEHGSMVFSRDVTVDVKRNNPDTRTWPLPWVPVGISDETSDVVITGPYPSLALTVFGDAERLDNSETHSETNNTASSKGKSTKQKLWRGDFKKYTASYWPAGAGGFVQGDLARKHVVSDTLRGTSLTNGASTSKSKKTKTSTKSSNNDNSRLPSYTFHGRSDEVINVNGNRVGTEQIERCLWGVEVSGYSVKDVCVVGAPDFVKGDAPVAFVAFQATTSKKQKVGTKRSKSNSETDTSDGISSIDLAAFKAAAITAVTQQLGSYAAPDHVFAVASLPKTITNKTSRKTLQLLLNGKDAPDSSLKDRQVLPPIKNAVIEWRKTGLVSNTPLNLTSYWHQYTFSNHVVQGRIIVPGAGWLCMLASDFQSNKLNDVAFMRGVFTNDSAISITKRRKALQATVGDDVVLRANVASGTAAPETVGPSEFPNSAVGGKRKATDDPADRKKAKKAKRNTHNTNTSNTSDTPVVTEEQTHAQHYRRCSALRLEYSGAYRAVRNVEWSGHVFVAEVSGGSHLAAVLDAGLQVVCAAVRASTFIPVAVKEFHITESPEYWDLDTRKQNTKILVHGEIVEQHAEYIIADLRYEREVVAGGKRTAKNGSDSPSMEVFAAMGRVRFARVEGSKPRLQPEGRRAERDAAGARAQTLDPKTSLARLRQLTTEQRVEAVRSVIRLTVSDLTDTDVDFDKTVFDNGMHSLNAVELLSRVNEALGTGVTTKLVVADAPMSTFATTVAEHAMLYVAPDQGDPNAVPFPNVDYATLHELVRRRLSGKTVGVTPYFFLAKYFAYNWFKKAFQFFRIGGHRFVLSPPRAIDLSVEVSMNRRVEFRDIDMNQHYTVEMIVARSVDGVEQLMARSGLSHVELYYKRNLFAAKIQSTFHKELALGDQYFIKTKITKVVGSLMDIRVAFLDSNEVLCFEILWTILIVLDSTERVLLDWENVDLMEGKRLRAGPGRERIEAPATPKKKRRVEQAEEE